MNQVTYQIQKLVEQKHPLTLFVRKHTILQAHHRLQVMQGDLLYGVWIKMLSRVIFNGLKIWTWAILNSSLQIKGHRLFRPFLSIKSTLSSQSQWNPFNMKKIVNAATNPGDKSSRNIVKARQVSIMAYHVRSIRFSVSACRRVPKNILKMIWKCHDSLFVNHVYESLTFPNNLARRKIKTNACIYKISIDCDDLVKWTTVG